VSVPQLIFIAMSVLMLGSSLGVVLARNQVYAAMSLVASFFFLAAIYALLGAHTIAILQVLVYAGAIVVLFLFVIMLLNIQAGPRLPFMQSLSLGKVFGTAASLAVGVVLVGVSLGATSVTKVKSVKTEDGDTRVTFDSTPFHQALYAAGALGTGHTATSDFEVLSVGMQEQPEHLIRPLGALPKVGEVVELQPQTALVQPNYGTAAELGQLMYGRYLLPFEVTSLLLLVAIVGAVVVAKGKI
jgi:NADH-quinone oxidoreductase subunit J